MRSESMKPWLGVFFLLLLLFMSIAAAYSGSSLAETKPAEQKSTPALPTVGSKAKLLELLKNASGSQPRLYLEKSTAVPAEGSAGRTQDQATSSASNTAAGYSQTNVQVEGVDEADIVKTDGKYIYQINNNRVLIIKAQPSSSLQVISRLTFSDKNFNLEEFYVDSNYLTVIGSSGQEIAVPCKTGQSDAKVFCPPNWRYRHSTQVYIYNISDKNSPKKIRELELEGRYLSSRKIGSDLYLASNQPFYFYNEDEVFLPTYKDSALGNLTTSPGYNDIKYFPDHIYPAYITLAGLKIDQPSVKADIQTCLGQSDNLYASASSLYLAVTDYNQPRSVIGQEIVPSSPGTTVFKFLLNGGKTIYSGKGEVNGTIINQFSMDEYNGCFRIATTSGNMWRNDQYTSKNNIYVLDKDMKLIGKLEGIAPGEQIYSTRFMGKRAYMVTFKKVDPFFVIDMKDPAKPSVLGKLKIPGYSDYLHPYDENHIIGFGKDTIETKGTGQDSWAYYQA
ncbi:beta-propeller domain-containing protein [Syntrophomonas palmitatica]|uniref:beta-propeller domain-containing protein n=1 Tax=Syntrophomonas palmitatica TaxID=402877 RepID=UPI000A69E000|nr:beta-propeller domain-containing protein [Syntrophomonas palmitatica]